MGNFTPTPSAPTPLRTSRCYGGTAEGGASREPLPNTTQACIDTYPRCIQIGMDMYQNALFPQSNIERPWARPSNTPLRLTHVQERIFCGTPCWVPPSIYSELSGLVPNTFFPLFLGTLGALCLGTFAQPESHFTCSSPRCAPWVVPNTFLLNSFWAFFRRLGRGEWVPLVQYLCKTQKWLHTGHFETCWHYGSETFKVSGPGGIGPRIARQV